MTRRSFLPNAGAFAVFVAVALWTMARLAGQGETAIPGSHAADNVAGLWNVWWFTYAVDHGAEIFRTPMLFAPYGTQLSLHTHATMHSLLAWPWIPMIGIIASHNVAITCGLALNGIVTYLLSRAFLAESPGANVVPHTLPSIVAGLLFACSAFVQGRVAGHINLVHAWVLPLFALALLQLQRKPGTARAVLVGAAGAVVVYTDYYYAVYAAILTVLWIANSALRATVTWKAPVFPRFRRVLAALILLSVVVTAMIASTQGLAVNLGPFEVSMRGVRNPLTVFWTLLALWMVCRFPFQFSIRRSIDAGVGGLGCALVGVGVLLVSTAPLWIALAGVIARGDYTTQRILWRSSPAGADALTLLLGHPEHFVSGPWTASAYGAFGIDRMEQSLWLGITPLLLIALTRRAWSHLPAARVWMVTGILFLLLALGPFLRVAGYDTALPLPQALLRYMPGFSNARIPGRAVVMVSLSVAMLSSFALAHLQRSRRWIAGAAAALLILETLPAPAGVYALPARDAVDEALRQLQGAAAVAELPLGIRDGFGQSGAFDHRALVHQIWHQHALVGGFVARLPSSVKQHYLEAPLLTNLIEISTPSSQGIRLHEAAAREAASLGIAFLIVNRDTFVADRLPRSDLERAGFLLAETAGPRELYVAPAAERRHP
jgi:hypothetical protein